MRIRSAFVGHEGEWHPTETPAEPPRDPSDWSDNNLPWELKPGESLLDGIPSGVPIVEASSLTSSRDLYVILQTLEATSSGGSVYVRLGEGEYQISSFRSYGTGYHRGFANANRRVMGLIGQGVDKTTVRVLPTAASTGGAVDLILDPPLDNSVQVCALFFDNRSTSAPLFISGIDFVGTLQTPFSTYSTAAQTRFRRNHTVPSPLAWSGINTWYCIPGSRIQYCRFQGFAFTLNNQPPYELGAICTNRDGSLLIRRIEIDGRSSPAVNPTRPRMSGSIMLNKSTLCAVEDTWMHHTRRSGWATNTNTGNRAETYIGRNVKCEEIANLLDGWAMDQAGFNGANIEEVVGKFELNNCWFNNANNSYHIVWAIPYSGAPGVYSSPTEPVLFVRGFHTDDTQYGGCLRIAIYRNPNSTGDSPLWHTLNNNFAQGLRMFDIRDAHGNAMTGVRNNTYNAAGANAPNIYRPSTHFVVVM